MANQKLIDGFRASKQRFIDIDGDNFGACMKEVFNPKEGNAVEWRIRKSDDAVCVIQYYEGGKGYNIYVSEEKVVSTKLGLHTLHLQDTNRQKLEETFTDFMKNKFKNSVIVHSATYYDHFAEQWAALFVYRN